MPSQRFQTSATTPTSPERAWTALQRAETWQGIAGVDHISDATHTADGHLRSFAFAVRVGGVPYRGTSTVTDAAAGERMHLELSTSEVLATIGVRLERVDSHTEVEFDLMVQSRSFLAGMFFGAIADSIGRNLAVTAVDFAHRLAQSD